MALARLSSLLMPALRAEAGAMHRLATANTFSGAPAMLPGARLMSTAGTTGKNDAGAPEEQEQEQQQPSNAAKVAAAAEAAAARAGEQQQQQQQQPEQAPQDEYDGGGGGYSDSAPRLVVFGGNGYVGSRVCQAALRVGLEVVSVSRSGTTPKGAGEWAQEVEWYKGDALDPGTWRDALQGALGVVSCVGAFGSNAQMYKVNGEANIGIAREAAAAGVHRMAYISAHEYPIPAAWHLQDFLLKGYFQGKRAAERALFEAMPQGGVALRPGFIYGTRKVGGGVGLPLGLIGAPMEKVIGMLPGGGRSLAGIPLLGAGFVPPVSVEAVGKAAVAAATDPSVPPGVMDVWDIQKYV